LAGRYAAIPRDHRYRRVCDSEAHHEIPVITEREEN